MDADRNHPGEFSTISEEGTKSRRPRLHDDLAVEDEASGSGGMMDPEIFWGRNQKRARRKCCANDAWNF